MKIIILFLTLSLLLTIQVSAQNTSTLTISREFPYKSTLDTIITINDSTQKRITVTTYKKHILKTEVTASREYFLGIGSSPEINDLNQSLMAQGNSAVSAALANAINKDPKYSQILKDMPNPANPRDHRIIMDYKGIPYYYGRNGRSIYYGLPGRTREIPIETFNAFMRAGKQPKIW